MYLVELFIQMVPVYYKLTSPVSNYFMGQVTQDQLDELDYSDKRNREKGDVFPFGKGFVVGGF
jgi:hypothetical protein